MAKLLSNASAKWITQQRRKATAATTRIVRTPFIAASGFLGWRQWHVSIADGAIRVRSGSLAWGGGHNAVWPSGEVSRSNYGTLDGGVTSGSSRYVIWYTDSPPCPTGDCPDKKGSSADFEADPGNVILADAAEGQEGWTDWRLIAIITHSGDNYIVNQILTSEITVNAIELKEPEEPEEPKPPPCGHPGNASGAGMWGGGGAGGGAGGGGGEHPGDSVEDDHPGDGEGEDGVTPESGGCGEEPEE